MKTIEIEEGEVEAEVAIDLIMGRKDSMQKENQSHKQVELKNKKK